jgi:hypothetical protein
LHATEDIGFNTGQNATKIVSSKFYQALLHLPVTSCNCAITERGMLDDVRNKRIKTEFTRASRNENNMIVTGLAKTIKQQIAIGETAKEAPSQFVAIFSKTSL